jgi:hypothetical protein
LGGRFVAPLLTGSVIGPINTTKIAVALVPISKDLGVSGDTPSDGGVQLMGWIVAGAALVALAMTALDRSLRE